MAMLAIVGNPPFKRLKKGLKPRVCSRCRLPRARLLAKSKWICQACVKKHEVRNEKFDTNPYEGWDNGGNLWVPDTNRSHFLISVYPDRTEVWERLSSTRERWRVVEVFPGGTTAADVKHFLYEKGEEDPLVEVYRHGSNPSVRRNEKKYRDTYHIKGRGWAHAECWFDATDSESSAYRADPVVDAVEDGLPAKTKCVFCKKGSRKKHTASKASSNPSGWTRKASSNPAGWTRSQLSCNSECYGCSFPLRLGEECFVKLGNGPLRVRVLSMDGEPVGPKLQAKAVVCCLQCGADVQKNPNTVADFSRKSSVNSRGVKRNRTASSSSHRKNYKIKKYSLDEGKQKFEGYDEAHKVWRTFHKSEPGGFDVYEFDDGRKETTVLPTHVALGRAFSEDYFTPWKSNKQGTRWKHEHVEGFNLYSKRDIPDEEKFPLTIYDPWTKTTRKVGGRYQIKDWWYD